jgi:hypothetical protein
MVTGYNATSGKPLWASDRLWLRNGTAMAPFRLPLAKL